MKSVNALDWLQQRGVPRDSSERTGLSAKWKRCGSSDEGEGAHLGGWAAGPHVPCGAVERLCLDRKKGPASTPRAGDGQHRGASHHHQTRSRGLSHHGMSWFLLLQIFQKVQNLEQILGRLDVDAVNEARSMSRSSMH